MRETKDQTISRLENVIEVQKKELSEVKKDRKRLNYAVERLEKEKEKLSAQSSKDDIEKIKELETQIEELRIAITEKDKAIKDIKEVNSSLKADIDEYRKVTFADYQKYEKEIISCVIDKILEWRRGHVSDYQQLKAYQNGERYYCFDFINYPNLHIYHSIFSTEDLFIRIHPKNGRTLTPIDHELIKKYFENRIEYLWAMKEFENFKRNNPNVSNDELVEWTYNKGMELLPKYEEMIF